MSERHLDWKADGSLTRFRAELDNLGEHLLIDHDAQRPGSPWHLTWFAPHRKDVPAEGHHLAADEAPGYLKADAENWMGFA